LVVDADEHRWRLIGGGEYIGLVHVALADRAIAVEDDRDARVGQRVRRCVPRLAHRIADAVQRVGTDDHVVVVKAQPLGVPVTHLGALEDRQDPLDGQTHQQSQPVFTMAWEDVIGRTEGGAHANLNGLLAQQWRPQAELSLTLQRGGLGIETPDSGHVAQQADRLDGL